MSEFWIVQHAEKERDPADPSDPGLTDRGRRQALGTAAYLGAAGAFDLLCSSPLRRARETAEVIATRLGLPVRVDARLRERMNWGEGSKGTTGSTPQPLEAFLREWDRATTDRDYVPACGDSSRAAGERFRLLLEELSAAGAVPDARGHQGHRGLERTLLVSHGGVTVDLLRTLVGDGAVRAAAPAAIERGIPSCAITRVQRRSGAWELLCVGDVGHLAAEHTDWRAF